MSWLDWLDAFLWRLIYGDKPMTPQPTPETPSTTPNLPPTAPLPPEPTPTPPPAPKYLWDTPANVRHSVRVICDEMGLTVEQKNDLCATVACESGFNPKCIHNNIVQGRVTSTDYGIAQVNDFWHIGPGKDFPSVDYVLNNPEACIRWMCKQWKAGHARLWVCYAKNMYQQYL